MIQAILSRRSLKLCLQVTGLIFICSLFLINIQSNSNTITFKLEHCNCDRTLVKIPDEDDNVIDTEEREIIEYKSTTCGQDAYKRGAHQKVAGFSFYGNRNSSEHKSKEYFEGIKENLYLLTKLYNDSWTLRLYYDLEDDHPLMSQLCDLACADNHLDLCYIQSLPGTPVINASNIFAMNWRFFPTLDPQVDVYISRDLDSRISEREVAAVEEWLESDKVVHSMRDHPAHFTEMLGAGWGARIDQPNIRHKWVRSWEKIFKDKINYAGRSEKGPDQTILQRYVWPWAKRVSYAHDSYNCKM